MSTVSTDSPSLVTTDRALPALRVPSYEIALKILAESAPFDALIPLASEVQDNGRTLLHIAAESGPPILVQELLKAGADTSPQDTAGQTPLHLAAFADNDSATTTLLLAGAKADAKDKYARTPLHLAAIGGAIKSTSTLLDKVKEISDHLDIFGHTAKALALALGHKETAALFPEDPYTALFIAKKMLSQISGYGGSFQIAPFTIEAEGFLPYLFSAKYADVLEEEHPLKQAMLKAANIKRSAVEIVSSITAKELVIIHCITATDAHSFSIVIWQDFMMICNRGLRPKEMPTIKCYKIDPSKITVSHIAPLLGNRLKSDWKLYVYEELPSALSQRESLKEDSELCALFERLAPKEQKVGNCSAASVKTAGRAALILHHYYKDLEGFDSHALGEAFIESKRHSFMMRKLLEDECLANFDGKSADSDSKLLINMAKIKRRALENKHLSGYRLVSSPLPSPLITDLSALIPEGFR